MWTLAHVWPSGSVIRLHLVAASQDEAAALETEMEARHAKELQALDDRVAAEAGDGGPVDAVAAALAANSLYGRAADVDSKQVSRALYAM